uniref:WGS project CBMG000000000 data, contig CS5907-c002599 n=1 Tax=Fusarium acuminatum CS5907 TaxID=1318461 RepID=A0A090M9R5_9HYPO|nr:unnamed protein product [Fusarium acuminatum CS5907]
MESVVGTGENRGQLLLTAAPHSSAPPQPEQQLTVVPASQELTLDSFLPPASQLRAVPQVRLPGAVESSGMVRALVASTHLDPSWANRLLVRFGWNYDYVEELAFHYGRQWPKEVYRDGEWPF